MTAAPPEGRGRAQSDEPLLRAEAVVKHFPVRAGGFRASRERVHALDGVSLDIGRGETVGLVGESGSGKSTFARCVTRLHTLTSGQVVFDGDDITGLSRRQLRPYRSRVQLVFQDPYGSLNPRRRVGAIIAEPLVVHRSERGEQLRRRVAELMELVGLNPEHYNRFPSQFSGGQRQRIGIARALALRPELVVCDEPVSALDISVQAQIINLLADLQAELGLTYLFISHDLSVVRHVSRRIAVLYLGKLVELAPARELFSRPRHPYTSGLLAAVPPADPDAARAPRRLVPGDAPSPISPPSGCRFRTRCPRAARRCVDEEPQLAPRHGDGPDHLAACHFPLEDGASPWAS